MRLILQDLRELLTINQVALSERLNITRQTLQKYEENPTGIPLHVMTELAPVLGVPYYSIIDGVLPFQRFIAKKMSEEQGKEVDFNSDEVYQKALHIHFLRHEKLTQTLLYALETLGGRVFMGRAGIGKLLYFINYDYFVEKGKPFFNIPFIRETKGPIPVAFDDICNSLKKRGILDNLKSKNFYNSNQKYIPRVSADFSAYPSDEISFIKKELRKYNNFGHNEFNELLGKNIPFLATPMEIIPSLIKLTPEILEIPLEEAENMSRKSVVLYNDRIRTLERTRKTKGYDSDDDDDEQDD